MIINYSELDMNTRYIISTTVSKRLSAEVGKTLDAGLITDILLRFEVNVEITDEGSFFICRDGNLEVAVKHLCTRL